jgi:EmrB/QacA subfamily drug resistance transporter
MAAAPSFSRTRNPWFMLLILCLGFFMILLDLTIVNIAIPNMIDNLHASLDQILWVLNAYILTYAVLLITAGRLGDMFGPKLMFLIGLIVFTLASIACSLAPDPNVLIAARIAQGVGGAILTPQTLSMLTNIFPPERRGAAFGVWGAVAGVASVTGPTLGGFLVTHYDWRAVFWVNVPVGVIALGLAIWYLPELRYNRRHSLDLVGVVLISASLFAGVFGLIEGQRYHWGPLTETATVDLGGGHWGLISIPAMFVVSLILLALFVLWERRRDEPLVPFALFRQRNFTIGNLLAAIVSFGMLGLFLPLTIFLQSVLGFSALKAGLTFAPMSLVSMVVAPIAGRLSDRYGGKYILIGGLTLFATGMGLVIRFASLNATQLTFTIPVMIAGLGLGCTFAPMTTVTMRRVPGQLAGAASGVLNTVRQVGGAIGSAAVGAILQNQLASQLGIQAEAFAFRIPAPFRRQFIAGLSSAGSALEVGPRRSFSLPPTVPPQAAQAIRQAAHDAFGTAYLNAMRPALLVPIGVLLVGAALGTLIERRKRFEAPVAQQAASAVS